MSEPLSAPDDWVRRFGGIGRLYGEAALARFGAAAAASLALYTLLVAAAAAHISAAPGEAMWGLQTASE